MHAKLNARDGVVPPPAMDPGSRSRESDDAGRHGMDETGRSTIGRGLRALVPQRLARRALSVSVSTDRDEYAVGEEVEITVEIGNRLPLPITVATAGGRIWGWTVDGELEASDERRRASEHRDSIDLRARETRRFDRTWDGRFKRTGSPTRWVEADPGEYEIAAYVATPHGRVRDETRVRLRR